MTLCHSVFMATLNYRYEFRLQDPKQERLRTSEGPHNVNFIRLQTDNTFAGFLRKPLESVIRIRRRNIEI